MKALALVFATFTFAGCLTTDDTEDLELDDIESYGDVDVLTKPPREKSPEQGPGKLELEAELVRANADLVLYAASADEVRADLGDREASAEPSITSMQIRNDLLRGTRADHATLEVAGSGNGVRAPNSGSRQ